MLKLKTTFVIGAGASHDLNFPLGDSLREKIITLLRNDGMGGFNNATLRGCLIQHCQQLEGENGWPRKLADFERAASIICAGLPFARSIDGFLDSFRNNDDVVYLSKLAISIIILQSESDSALSFEKFKDRAVYDIKLKSLLDCWHPLLGQIIYDGYNQDNLEDIFENVSFIIFNYDRCIEQFLIISLMRRFNISLSESLEVLKKCSIKHPYGSVGAINPNDDDYISFGNTEKNSAITATSKIKTFTESIEDGLTQSVKDIVAESQVIVFLGFGWLPFNIELLRTERRRTNARHVFATVHKVDHGEFDIISDQIDRILGRKRYTIDNGGLQFPSANFVKDMGTCKNLIQNCWLRLTQAT